MIVTAAVRPEQERQLLDTIGAVIEALALALGFVVGAALRRWIAVPVASGIAGALALLLHTDTNRAFLVALLAVLAGAAAGAAVVGLRERQAARRD